MRRTAETPALFAGLTGEPLLSFFFDEILFSKLKKIYFILACRTAFEHKPVTFEEHVSKEHNMWNYLYFVVYLRTKDVTEYTGPERSHSSCFCDLPTRTMN